MASEVAGCFQLLCSFSQPKSFHRADRSVNPSFSTIRMPLIRLQSSRRLSNFAKEGDNLVGNPLNWNRRRSGHINGGYIYEDDDDDEEEEDEEDRSLDLLIRFVQNVFKKISRKARKAVRLVLPVTIPSQLVGFSVNGVIILTFMWVLKAFLEVICTLGSVVFVSILLIRGIWTGISYLQENRSHNRADEPYTWRGAQPTA